MEVKSEFQHSHLKIVGNDPDEWIMKLEGIYLQLQEMGSSILDENVLVHILNNFLSNYEVQISKLENQLGSATNVLTIKDVHNKLNLKYACLKKTTADKMESENALLTINWLKGKCTHCGKLRHKGSECWYANDRN